MANETEEIKKHSRWYSPEFRIYSQNCPDPIEAINCTLEGYGFGPGLSSFRYFNTTKNEICISKCNKDIQCLYISWDSDEKACHFLTNKIYKTKETLPYFCRKNGSTILKKQHPCKNMTELKKTESWVSTNKRILKSANIVESAQSLVKCWKKAKSSDSTFFFFNSTGEGTCHLSITGCEQTNGPPT